MRKAKKEKREETIRKWQRKWNATRKGKWTRTLIPDLRRWTARNGEVSFHLTQAMSGHGCFNAYLHKMGKRASPRCFYCKNPKDDAEHTIFECREGEDIRRSTLHDGKGTPLIPTTKTEEMLRNTDSWERVKRAWRT